MVGPPNECSRNLLSIARARSALYPAIVPSDRGRARSFYPHQTGGAPRPTHLASRVHAYRALFSASVRGARRAHDPWRSQGIIVENELSGAAGVARTATILLTGSEC